MGCVYGDQAPWVRENQRSHTEVNSMFANILTFLLLIPLELTKYGGYAHVYYITYNNMYVN